MASEIASTSLELLQDFRTLELATTTSVNGAALSDAMLRTMPTEGLAPGSFATISIEMPGAGPWLTYDWRVWWASPAFWRDDLTYWNSKTSVCIVRPDAAMAYVPQQQTLYTSERLEETGQRKRVPPRGMQLPTLEDRFLEFPLVRPRLPTSDWRLTTVGQELYMGRMAHRVLATRKPDSVRASDPRQSGYWAGVDEYECVIDNALHLVLSVTGMVDNVRVASISVDHLSVDTPIPPGTFDFVPPVGTRIAQVL